MKTVSCCLLFLLFNSFIFAQQWTSLGLNSETISSIAVDWANPNIIYAGSSSNFSSGTTGGIFKSTNGGATWDTLIRGVTVRQIVVHPKSSNIIYATLGVNVLTSPGIIKTTDAGKSWQGVDSGLMLSWEEGVSQLAIDPEHPDTLYCGMAGLEGGKFYRSIDGGKNWNSLGDTTALSNGVVSVAIDPDSSNVIFAGTEGIGNILKSTDYGVNWILTGLVNVGIIYSIEFVKGTSTIYSAASSDIVPVGVFKSTDGGKTWSNPKTGLPNYVSGSNIQIASNGTVYLAGSYDNNGGIYKSIDGESWEKIGLGNGRVGTITLFGTKLYATNSGGIYVTDIVTSVSDRVTSIPSNFSLLQNYPNPFNPSTLISYGLPKDGVVTLKIYEVLGKEVKTLADGFKTQGKYTVSFDASKLASGIYFYQLRAGNFISTKKMLLLK